MSKLINLEAMRARLAELRTTAQGLVRDDGTVTETEAFDTAIAEAETLRTDIEATEKRAEALRKFAISGTSHIEHGSQRASFDTADLSVRGQAMRHLDKSVKDNAIQADAAERVEKLMRGSDSSFATKWAATAGDPDYGTAFAKLVADPVRGHMLWSPQEQAAFARVEAVRGEQRAMSLTDASGGFMVPVQLDPAIILSGSGSNNPLRKLARVVQTAASQWSGVTSAGATAEWIAEATQVADATPTLLGPDIPVYKGDAFIPYSFEVGQDAPNLLAELQYLLADAADQLQATAYTTGTGSGQPTGIITSLVATGGTSVVTAAGESITAADVFSVQNAAAPRFSGRSQWTANLAIVNTLRQLETTAGALKFPELGSGQLLGRAIHENSNMDGTINAAATESNYSLLFGDYSNFVIVDRIGTTLELVPNLMGANGRPTGQRGALLWFRTGSNVVVPNAFRLLKVATTA